MGLSSNTLWHQTRKDGLRGIIKDKCLYLSYSQEDVTLTRFKDKFAYPMVSVCDLPLSETGNYLKKYGDYTIGFSSEWGRKNHFAAVWYCDQNSFALKTILDLLVSKIREYEDRVEEDIDYQRIVYILSYVKLYEGPLSKRNYKEYRFYDERELRFVPNIDRLKEIGEKPMLWEYEAYKRAHNNSSLLPKALNVPFDWGDIKYIIVEKEFEKDEIRDMIMKYSGLKSLNISFFTNKEVKEDIIGLTHDVKEEQEFRAITEAEIDEIINELKKI